VKFAHDTSVPVERSRAEIESLVTKYGATKFISSWDDRESLLFFVCQDRMIKFRLPLPTMLEAETTESGQIRHLESTRKSWLEQEKRRRWRALVLCIKAKLEAVASGIESFDEAFLSHIVTDNKRTVYERVFVAGSSIKMLPPAEDSP
jgi:hypothetical protein